MNKLILILLIATAGTVSAEEWKTTVADRFGNPIWEVSDFRSAPAILEGSCYLYVTAKNISGGTMGSPGLSIEAQMTGRETPFKTDLYTPNWARKSVPGGSVELRGMMDLDRCRNKTVTVINIQRAFDAQSPAEKEAESKQQAERDAINRQRWAEEAAIDRKYQAACAQAYRATIDKAQRDLTVRESQQIFYCTSKDWYHD